MSRGRLVALFLCGVFVAAASWAQLSPGKLSAPHAGLEGSTHCLDCHAPRQGVAPDRCLDCHVALRQRVAADQGLHARPEFQRCETCHIEHHGRDFELIFWGDEGRDAFDHRRTGWPLTGAHAAAACRDCHRPGHLLDAAGLKAGKADPATTFLGLSSACLTCHQDEHRGQFAPTSCLDCHGTTAWKPATGFDHGSTDFPLVGAHADLACGDCHPRREDAAAGLDRAFLQLSGVAHADCADCHRDPHGGRLGPTCSTCHTPTAWSQVDRTGFDHSRTRFPLTGLHRNLACAACHSDSRPAARQLAFGSCADCHADPHQGRLGSACASCHDTSGWKRVAAGAFDHDRTRFPLRGAHQEVACADCHTSGRPAGTRLAFASCADCHGDPHLGQFLDQADITTDGASRKGAMCSDCHTVEGFVPSTFTVADHQQSRFHLDGAHLAVPCVDCHLLTEPEALPRRITMQRSSRRRARRSADGPVRRFRFAATTCIACHADPHGGATQALDVACADCHQTGSFHTVAAEEIAFDHQQATGFALSGGHLDVACLACHSGATAEGVSFQGTPNDCASCHRDPHFGTTPAADSAAPVNCADCHQMTSWQATSFDHARDTGFGLEGAHGRLACAQCHRLEGPTQRLVPPPTTCQGCHGQASFMSPSSTDL